MHEAYAWLMKPGYLSWPVEKVIAHVEGIFSEHLTCENVLEYGGKYEGPAGMERELVVMDTRDYTTCFYRFPSPYIAVRVYLALLHNDREALLSWMADSSFRVMHLEDQLINMRTHLLSLHSVFAFHAGGDFRMAELQSGYYRDPPSTETVTLPPRSVVYYKDVLSVTHDVPLVDGWAYYQRQMAYDQSFNSAKPYLVTGLDKDLGHLYIVTSCEDSVSAVDYKSVEEALMAMPDPQAMRHRPYKMGSLIVKSPFSNITQWVMELPE
ncbi:hypothetical protein KIPB_006020 [Kipferlia bialata]|uniref:Uncharacterized protein n=1 Tax=Kipferlia bialata TaxID=797122 RepID=A0A391NUA8_9EUKA|nr:hypothetical protein KIPB_006020 [Kipferlia bialata]|eukprot:g6020.t1